jgi:hypothetical protein
MDLDFREFYSSTTSVLDPYVPYLLRRWNKGCHNDKRLYREIRKQGYQNSEETCTHFVAQLRRAEAEGKQPSSVPRARRGSVAGLSPTAKNVAALCTRYWGVRRGSRTGRPIMALLGLLERRWALRVTWELRRGRSVSGGCRRAATGCRRACSARGWPSCERLGW